MWKLGKSDGFIGTSVQIAGRSFTVDEKIGDGGFGAIYKCTDASNTAYVVKVLQAPDQQHIDAIKSEIEIQKMLSENVHVVKLIGSTLTSSGCYHIVMEFCESNLVSEMRKAVDRGLRTSYIANVFASVLRAICEMHDKGLSHRDLKPENVLGKSGIWKLCDFGSSTAKEYDMSELDTTTINCAKNDIEKDTTPSYRAPEMIDLYRGHKIGIKADIWALGCLLYKLCTLKDAFPEATNLQILNGKYNWNICSWEVDERLKSIVDRCLRPNPDERPTARDLLREIESNFELEQVTTFPDDSAPKVATAQPKVSFIGKLMSRAQQDALPSLDFNTIMLAMRPRNSDTVSDESDIEFDDEAETVTGIVHHSWANQTSKEEFEFEFEDDEPTPTVSVINMDTTIEECATQEKPTISFDIFNKQAALIDFGPSESPASSIVHSTCSNEIDDILFQQQEDRTDEIVDYMNLMKTDLHEFGVKLIQMDHLDRSALLYNLVLRCEDTTAFLVPLIHESGPHAADLLLSVPALVSSPVNDFLQARKVFASQYPMFEGNFSLSEFTKNNKANPPPPGSPPVALEVAQELQKVLDSLLKAFRAAPNQVLGEECIGVYQATSYIIAKLKLFKIKTTFLDTITIPVTKNHHSLLKRAFDQSGMKFSFPTEPFNFDDPMIQKRLRAPLSNCKYEI